MKTFKFFTALFIAASIAYGIAGLSGCKQCDPGCCNVKEFTFIDKRLLDYYFKTGSYWVYEEETSLQTDSQYLYERADTLVKRSTRCPKFEFWEKKLQKIVSVKGTMVDSFMIWAWPEENNLRISKINDYYNNSVLFSMDLQEGEVSSGIKYIGKESPAVVNGNSFENVFKFKNLVTYGSTSQQIIYPTEYWFSPKLGIIKKIVDDPSGTKTWNIKRWSVSQ